jgi:hypothetical protein
MDDLFAIGSFGNACIKQMHAWSLSKFDQTFVVWTLSRLWEVQGSRFGIRSKVAHVVTFGWSRSRSV